MKLYKLHSHTRLCVLFCTEDELNSSEESGKDWDELEDEARKGKIYKCVIRLYVCQGFTVLFISPAEGGWDIDLYSSPSNQSGSKLGDV